jgi:hypothetical protein
MTGDIRYFIWDDQSAIADGKEDITTGPHMYKTPRGVVNYAASFNVPDDCVTGHEYIIEKGSETAEIYAFSQYDISMDTDYVEVAVKPYKKFATFKVDFIEDITDRFQNMICVVRSSSAGVDLCTLEAVKGEYEYTCGPNRDGQIYFKLSRQGFDDLELVVLEDDEELNVYSLSTMLEVKGYDWSALNLKDAEISLSLTRQEADIKIGDWEDGGVFEGGL